MVTAHEESPRRNVLGWILALAALATLALGWGETLNPLANTTFGLAIAYDHRGAYVASVSPGLAADKAGVKVGDGVDLSVLTQSERYRLVLGSPPGSQLSVRVRHDGAWRLVELSASRNANVSVLEGWPLLWSATITLFLVALIALRRPSLATAALILYGSGAVLSTAVTAEFSWIPDPWFGGVATFTLAAFSWLPVFALLPFIVRFPHPPTTRAAVMRMHLADGIFIAAAIVLTVQAVYEPVRSNRGMLSTTLSASLAR